MTTADYEGFWRGYWNDTTRYGPACRHRRRRVSALIRSVPHRTVLDLGCGDGTLLAELGRTLDSSLAGADVSAEALRIARQNVPQAEFFQLNLSTDALPSGRTYDVIVLSEVLEHLEDDEGLLRRIAPLTRHLVISVPGGPADKVDRRFGHVRNYSGDLLVRKLEGCGFEVIRFERWGWPWYDLHQSLAYREGEVQEQHQTAGPYSPLKRAVAHLVYALYFLNVFPRGMQVFALARSKRFREP